MASNWQAAMLLQATQILLSHYFELRVIFELPDYHST
jgi:hypothetical protein